MAGPLAGIMGRMGGLMFGAQVGQALGRLADEVVTSTDVGLPLAPAGTAVLVPQNVDAFAAGLDRPADEVRLFLALREAAPSGCSPTSRGCASSCTDAVHAYARGITIDREAIERGLDGGHGRHGGRVRPAATRRASSGCSAAACSSRRRPRSSRWRCAGWRPCWPWSRAGSTSSSPRPPRTGCPGTPRWPRRCAGGGPRAGPPSRPSPRWSGCSCARAGCATRPPCGRRWTPAARRGRAATGSGPTRTCCPPADDLDEPMDFVARQGSTTSSAALTAAEQDGRPAHRRARPDGGTDDGTDGPTSGDRRPRRSGRTPA